MYSCAPIGGPLRAMLPCGNRLANQIRFGSSTGALREPVAAVVRNRMDQKRAARYVRAWVDERIDPSDRERFLEMSERELIGLHPGSLARFGIRQSEFWAGHEVWRT